MLTCHVSMVTCHISIVTCHINIIWEMLMDKIMVIVFMLFILKCITYCRIFYLIVVVYVVKNVDR